MRKRTRKFSLVACLCILLTIVPRDLTHNLIKPKRRNIVLKHTHTETQSCFSTTGHIIIYCSTVADAQSGPHNTPNHPYILYYIQPIQNNQISDRAEVCRAGAEGGASGQGFMGNVCRPDLQIHSESKEV